MSTVKFNCRIGTSNPEIPLGMEIWFDNHVFFNQDHVQDFHAVEYEFEDDDSEHELRFVLKNKLPEHTGVDESGKILSDARLCIDNIQFDEIDCHLIVCESAEYRHNFNGTGADTQERFYGEMGCNGTVSLKFATPIYLWLLEKM